MKEALRLAAACAFLLWASALHAADTGEHELIEIAKLCGPSNRLNLVIENLYEDAESAGITKERIRNAVEIRLRSARIYDPDAEPYLYVNLNVAESGGRSVQFALDVEYMRLLRHELVNFSVYATTWDAGTLGKGDAGFVMDSLDELVDRFIAAYLRVGDSEGCRNLRSLTGE